MKKLLLTSAGFSNREIEKKFLELVEVSREKIKALFIPTAAVSEEAKAMVRECKEDLLRVGILEEHIVIYDLDREITCEEICEFNTVYFCGGSSQHLLNKINQAQFNLALDCFLDNGGVFVGVSAGSIIAATNLENNLGYLNCHLSVHKTHGTEYGDLNTRYCPNVSLTDNQAIWIVDDDICIIG